MRDDDSGKRYRVDAATLWNYIQAGGPYVDGYERHEILDAVALCNAVKNGGG